MENVSFEALVELVTKEVLKSVSSGETPSAKPDGKPLALLVGNEGDLPAFAQEKYAFKTIDSYNGDIASYECVFVCELTCAELADCALGRDCRAVPCAVTKALLNGKKVFLLEAALPHRKYKETANRAFYSMFEGYVNSLRSFGVELIRQQWYGKNLNKNAVADNSVDKVITESLAINLCKKAQDEIVRLKKGTVITPSAKDIFNHSNVKVEFVD